MPMKKFWVGLLVVSCVALMPLSASAQNTQDFTIDLFEADYYISKADDGVSQMEVRENIVAQFPNYDQNHGILRAIPESYNGHSLELKIKSVQKPSGANWDYSTYSENDNLVLQVGDANTYVYGLQEYIITYEVRGVDNLPNASRIFWDVNGDQWQQTFNQVIARIHVTADLANAIIDEPECFTGAFGSLEQNCAIGETVNSEGDKVLEFQTVGRLASGQTLTFEIPFASGTFAAYKMSPQLIKRIIIWSIIEVMPAIIAVIIMTTLWRKFGRDPKGSGVILPQYLPPKGLSVLGCSLQLRQSFTPNAISATIIDLATRHYIKIYETGKKTFGGYKYDLELIKKPDNLLAEEQAVVEMIFTKAMVGKRISLDNLDKKLYRQAQKIGREVEEKMTRDGYFLVKPQKARLPYFIIGGVVLLLGFVLPPYTLGLLLAGAVILIFGYFMSAPTKKGAELKEYLLGMKQYMKLAEAERLKVLQSPRGELVQKVDVSDNQKLVKLYERLLPYAMLFGIEKDWAEQFAVLYKQSPDWYSGSHAFSALYFAGAMHGIGSAASASFSSPNSSGASGAGGGGGGGGGGGW